MASTSPSSPDYVSYIESPIGARSGQAKWVKDMKKTMLDPYVYIQRQRTGGWGRQRHCGAVSPLGHPESRQHHVPRLRARPPQKGPRHRDVEVREEQQEPAAAGAGEDDDREVAAAGRAGAEDERAARRAGGDRGGGGPAAAGGAQATDDSSRQRGQEAMSTVCAFRLRRLLAAVSFQMTSVRARARNDGHCICLMPSTIAFGCAPSLQTTTTTTARARMRAEATARATAVSAAVWQRWSTPSLPGTCRVHRMQAVAAADASAAQDGAPGGARRGVAVAARLDARPAARGGRGAGQRHVGVGLRGSAPGRTAQSLVPARRLAARAAVTGRVPAAGGGGLRVGAEYVCCADPRRHVHVLYHVGWRGEGGGVCGRGAVGLAAPPVGGHFGRYPADTPQRASCRIACHAHPSPHLTPSHRRRQRVRPGRARQGGRQGRVADGGPQRHRCPSSSRRGRRGECPDLAAPLCGCRRRLEDGHAGHARVGRGDGRRPHPCRQRR